MSCPVPPSVWETLGDAAIRYAPWIAGIAYLFGPTPMTPERQWELSNIQAMAKQTRLTGKQMATDAPSWASDYSKEPGESCAEFAARILRLKYGLDPRALRTGPGSEYSKIKRPVSAVAYRGIIVASIRTVYLLEHVHTHEHGEEDVKTIGIYSSRENAEKAVERLRVQPGFQAAPEGFSIDAYGLDEDNWTEGFITVFHDASPEENQTEDTDGTG